MKDNFVKESSDNIIEINNQMEFEKIFGNGQRETMIADDVTIVLKPIKGTEPGDLTKGAWGGRGDDPENTYNGHPAYILKNSVRLSSNVNIVGFNEEKTIIVKHKSNVKFIIAGTLNHLLTGVRLQGWSFDGRGGVPINIVNIPKTMTLGGNLTASKNGGAFSLSWCQDCTLNCKIINHKTKQNGGAIAKNINVPNLVNNILAHNIYNCRAKNGGGTFFISGSIVVRRCIADQYGGAAYGCDFSKIYAVFCQAKRGGGIYLCRNIALTAYCCMAIDGGAADGCNYSSVKAYNCIAKNDGGAANACLECEIEAENCSANRGGAASTCHYSTINAICCHAAERGHDTFKCRHVEVDKKSMKQDISKRIVSASRFKTDNSTGTKVISTSNKIICLQTYRDKKKKGKVSWLH